MMRQLILSLFFLLSAAGSSKANFDFNANCIAAYKNVVRLNLPQAKVLIDQEKKLHPGNAITVFLENSYDYYSILFSNRKQDFDSWKSRKDDRISLIDEQDDRSPYFLYIKAHIQLQWALLYGQFGEYASAGFAINKAHGLLESNQKKYPGFLPDDIDRGMINVMLGSLPDGALKSSLRFFGIKGDVKKGVSMLENLVTTLPRTSYHFFYDELVFYLSNVQCDYAKDDAAYFKAEKYAQNMPPGTLKNYILGYSAIRTGHSKDALKWLSADQNPRYPLFHYYLGLAKLNLLDTGARSSFQNFLKYNRGNFFVKDCYLHLGWISVLGVNGSLAKNYFLLVKSKGNSYHEKDKQAENEAGKGLPDSRLLKARLLFDGGDYNKGIALLHAAGTGKFTGTEKLEYFYRLGRLHDAAGNRDEALSAYNQSIALGRNVSDHYAASSALYSGYICAKKNDKNRAKNYFNLAIGMKNHEYESGIEQKARQALSNL